MNGKYAPRFAFVAPGRTMAQSFPQGGLRLSPSAAAPAATGGKLVTCTGRIRRTARQDRAGSEAGPESGFMADGAGYQLVQAGRLLVANPLLPDPNFDRTVVLLLAYSEEGALGVVLNRPSETLVAAPLPRWEQLAANPAVVFVGGPVERQAVICLARGSGPPRPDEPSSGWQAVTGDVGIQGLDEDPDGLDPAVSQVRVFAGYAGWTGGQLENEIAMSAWWVVDAEPEDPFSDEPGELWKRVLRRQRGPLALVSAYPDNPNMN
jgi:putative transcriptional regulator